MSNKVLLSSNNVKPSLKIRKTFPNKILEKDKENQNNMRIFLLRKKLFVISERKSYFPYLQCLTFAPSRFYRHYCCIKRDLVMIFLLELKGPKNC